MLMQARRCRREGGTYWLFREQMLGLHQALLLTLKPSLPGLPKLYSTLHFNPKNLNRNLGRHMYLGLRFQRMLGFRVYLRF